jgi:transcriptional regulator
MYIPQQFQETRIDRLAEAMRDIELATVVTSLGPRYYTSHIPMLFKQSSEGMFLEGHVARANHHWTVLKQPTPSIAIFMGPQAYVSPSWYETKREHGKVVPTWNYLVVHVEGVLASVEDQSWVMMHLNELTDLNEQNRKDPWHVEDAPKDFIQKLCHAVVGLRMEVESIAGCWKMIQHRSEGDRSGTISGLLNSSDPGNHEVGRIMRSLERTRGSRT